MQTISTKQDTTAKTAVLARAAIREFTLQAGLPRPIGIRRARPGGMPVDLSVEGHEAWVEATGAVYLGTETLNHQGARYSRVSWVGKVPTAIGDVAVQLRIVQRVDSPVAVLVPGGAA